MKKIFILLGLLLSLFYNEAAFSAGVQSTIVIGGAGGSGANSLNPNKDGSISSIIEFFLTGNIPNQQSVAISANGDTTVVAASAGKKIYIFQFPLQCSDATLVIFSSGASNGSAPHGTQNGLGWNLSGGLPATWFMYPMVLQSGDSFVINHASGGTCNGTLWFVQQ